jgi:hypothetical protein
VLISLFHNVSCRKDPMSWLTRPEWCWKDMGISRCSTMMMEWKPGALQMARKISREEGQDWTANGVGSLTRPWKGKLLVLLRCCFHIQLHEQCELWILNSIKLACLDAVLFAARGYLLLIALTYWRLRIQTNTTRNWMILKVTIIISVDGLISFSSALITVNQCRGWEGDKTAKWWGCWWHNNEFWSCSRTQETLYFAGVCCLALSILCVSVRLVTNL